MTPRFSVLDPAGDQADRLYALWQIFFLVAAFVTIGIVVAEIAAVVVAARRRGPDDPMSAHTSRRMVAVIAVATGATVVILVGLLVVSVHTGGALAAMPEDALHVRIHGHQWWWQIEYEPDDPARRATTANELRIPVGRAVALELTSADVIHSFWVPSLHGKKDLVPGRTNQTWIVADAPGVYRGQCAEFCGLQHAQMALLVIAEPAPVFEAWLARQREPAPTPTTRAQLRGRELFLTGPCALCHTILGTPAGGGLGPDLTHVASRATLAAGTQASTREALTGWIVDPHRRKPGVRMPATRLPAQDLAALLDYLETLR